MLYDTIKEAKSMYTVKEVADGISENPFVIKSCVTKRGRESAPRLLDLTSLQVECDKKYG